MSNDQSEPLPLRTKHKDARRESSKKSAQKRRQHLIACNLCPDCRQPKDSTGYRCVVCKERQKTTPKDHEKLNKQGQERRAQKKSQGICTLCSEPAAPGYTKCKKHVESSRTNRQKFKAKQIADGKCTQCANPVVEGSLLCERHLRKKADSKKRVEEAVDAGLCRACMTAPADPDYKTCSSCRATTTVEARQRKQRMKEEGRCVCCGDVPLPCCSKCRICYLKYVAVQNGLTVTAWQQLDELWNNQNGKCPYTGNCLALGITASLDHKIPVAKGGTSDPTNLQWVSRIINTMKSDLLEVEFLSVISQITFHRKQQEQ